MQKDLFKKKLLEKEAEVESQDTLPPLNALFKAPLRAGTQPRSWDEFFDQRVMVDTPRGQFRAYYSPPSSDTAPLFVFQHGAGSSALTFASVAKTIREKMAVSPEEEEVAGCLAFDMRGHGETRCDDTTDFGLSTLVEDFFAVVGKYSGTNPLMLIGHSLGGSIVADAAVQKRLAKVMGLVVLDVVEGLTLESLNSMHKVLSTFPASFESPSKAIDWHVQNRHLRNKHSAAVSVPPLLRLDNNNYTWIMDLKSTDKYWQDWFEGLSSKFLKTPSARLLILAGTDRLDKELMIGQMQGKYQLMVFNEAGHFLHEDSPDKTALTLIDFWQRNGKPVNITPVFGKLRTT